MAVSVRIPAALAVCCAGALGAALGTPAQAAGPEPATPVVGRVLGGARAVVLDLLWLQADLRRNQGYRLELPALYRLITGLDPGNARAWEFHADVLITNLPLGAAHEPDGGWRYLREGLRLLAQGREANPDDEGLAFVLALHLLSLERGLVPGAPADWRARITDTFGIDSLDWAERCCREFHARAGHTGRICALLAVVCDLRGNTAEAMALREHLRVDHGMQLSADDSPLFDHDHDH